MKVTLNQKIEQIFKQVGEFGPYQLFVFILGGLISIVPAIVGYSFAFYAAVPQFRCKIPGLENDTYEIANEYHQELIDRYIPPPQDKSFKDKYDKCRIQLFNNESSSPNNYTLVKCNEWVYSKQYYGETLFTEWNLVCDNSTTKSLFSTLYFIGTYGVILSGLLSDKIGRKKTAYIFLLANAIVNILMTVLINVKFEDLKFQQYVFGVLRLCSGITTNVYAISVVLVIEICGPSKRVTAANFAYYLYIIGEFLVVLLAYLIRDYRVLHATFSAIMVSFLFYFWIVPESPRWLMTKERNNEAYRIFRRIAISNNKNCDELNELNALKRITSRTSPSGREDLNSVSPIKTTLDEVTTSSGGLAHEETEEIENEKLSVLDTFKLFFKSKRLLLLSVVALLNWLTNTLVYYGISFNTGELAGNPYLNFALSVLLELIAIMVSHYTFDAFGRKIPYSINMSLSGIALLLVLFIPTNLPYLVTILALTAKFAISFTYNGIYIITAEMYPTVIRNSAVSFCQTFARLGAVLAPNFQLLGDMYWYPIPFIIYGVFSSISAVLFFFFMPETKGKKLPDTIEEFLEKK